MADHEHSTPQGLDDKPPVGGMHALTLDAAERQLLQIALGELLQTVSRDEHLVPHIQSLLERVNRLASDA